MMQQRNITCSCGGEVTTATYMQTSCPTCGIIHPAGANAAAAGGGLLAVMPSVVTAASCVILVLVALLWAAAGSSGGDPRPQPRGEVAAAPAAKPSAHPPLSATTPAPAPAAKPSDLSPPSLFASVSPAVVQIEMADLDDNVYRGSGFLVSGAGLVVTNYHVVSRGEILKVRDSGQKLLLAVTWAKLRRQGSVQVEGCKHVLQESVILASSQEDDLAVINIGGQDHPFLKLLPPPPPEIGTHVYALGFQQGKSITLTDGMISAWPKEGGQMKYLQTSAPISPGSSGGPLFTARGLVVGVTVGTDANESSQNMNFAVPAEKVVKILSAARAAASRPARRGTIVD